MPPSVAGFIDCSKEHITAAQMTRVHTGYNEIAVEVKGDIGHGLWSKEEITNLERSVSCSKPCR